MDQENKKVSFGFTKSVKKKNIFDKPPEKQRNVQLIDCLESQRIKIKNAFEVVKGPLVIPMGKSVNILEKKRELKAGQVADNGNEKPDSELTVDELAARELIREAQRGKSKDAAKVLLLSAVTENVIEIEGKEEPTLKDYEAVPISDYGMAMLRGMGWSEGMGIGKNNKTIKTVEPSLRPKGMGLGATNAYKEQKDQISRDKNGKELVLKKGSFAKIIDGKMKGCYCEVQGFDEEAGRVIVKISLDGLVLNLNEFFVIPVTKEEYVKSSKVINIQKYEQFKNKEENDKNKVVHSKSYKDEHYTNDGEGNSKSESTTDDRKSKSRYRKNSTSGDEYHSENRKKSSKKHEYKRSESKKRHKHKNKSKDHRSSSESSVDSIYDRKSRGEPRTSSSSDQGHNNKRNNYKSHKHRTYNNDSESSHNSRKEKHSRSHRRW